jgi:diaminohydroxyphosphoribosylaminopyrimidine deaminase/5-amino-6-(5-phosphoribosylamino)uracil reductase
MNQSDHDFMRRAIRLAMNGRGAVEPNPMVGCVIVKDGRVIGEANHAKFGSSHAEPLALALCSESPRGASVYVTLEPCCHTDKKTPPCVPKLIEAGVARVIAGCLDPNPQVNGRGIAMLRDAGIEVHGPVMDAECRQLNAAFFKGTVHQRPYVTVKWAESADGKVAGPGGKRVWISNRAAFRAVHQLRARSDVILLGINTVLADDPLLTARGVDSLRTLRRSVLDSNLRLPLESQLVRTAAGEVTVFCTRETFRRSPKVEELQSLGIDLIPIKSDPRGGLSLDDVLFDLDNVGTHVLVEAGPTLARSFVEQNLVDRIWIIRSPNPIADTTAPQAVRVEYPAVGTVDLEGDVLTEYLNPRSRVFFAAEPSADLVRLLSA